MSQILETPIQEELSVGTSRWMTLIFNNTHTPYEAVVQILIIATHCTEEEAAIETWEAHHFGKASVHFGSEVECQQVAEIINTIGVRTEVCKEWDES